MPGILTHLFSTELNEKDWRIAARKLDDRIYCMQFDSVTLAQYMGLMLYRLGRTTSLPFM